MMFVEFPARSQDQVRPVSINPLHVVAVSPAGQDTCEVLTTARAFYVQVPYRDVMRLLGAQALVVEMSGSAKTEKGA